MNKKCKQCNRKFEKPCNCSKNDWKKRAFCSRECKNKAMIGKSSWNKGLKLSEMPKYKKMGFQKGHKYSIPRIFTKEDRKKSHEAMRKNGGPWNKGKIGVMPTGENHHNWKGGSENKLMHNKKRRALKLGAKGSHTLEQWQELKKKYNNMCLCCKKHEPEIKLTEDHIVPLSKGGTDYIENIQPLCQSCNTRKYTKIIDYVKTRNYSYINA